MGGHKEVHYASSVQKGGGLSRVDFHRYLIRLSPTLFSCGILMLPPRFITVLYYLDCEYCVHVPLLNPFLG